MPVGRQHGRAHQKVGRPFFYGPVFKCLLELHDRPAPVSRQYEPVFILHALVSIHRTVKEHTAHKANASSFMAQQDQHGVGCVGKVAKRLKEPVGVHLETELVGVGLAAPCLDYRSHELHWSVVVDYFHLSPSHYLSII